MNSSATLERTRRQVGPTTSKDAQRTSVASLLYGATSRSDKITEEHLRRLAIVYVRQSHPQLFDRHNSRKIRLSSRGARGGTSVAMLSLRAHVSLQKCH